MAFGDLTGAAKNYTRFAKTNSAQGKALAAMGFDINNMPTIGIRGDLGQANAPGAAQGVVDGKLFYSNFNPLVDAGNNHRVSTYQQNWANPDWAAQNTTAYTDPNTGQKGFLIDKSLINDPNFKTAQVAGTNFRGENTSQSPFGTLGSAIGLAAMFVPGLQPFAAGLNVLNGVKSGNLGQVAGGMMGYSPVSNYVNSGISGAIGNYAPSLASAIGPAGVNALTKGITSAGMTGLSGGDLNQMLTNGLASGSGNYAGGYLKDQLSGNGLPNSVVGGLTNAGVGALTSAIKGGDIGKGALISGASGVLSGLGKDISSATGVDPTSLVGNLLNNVPAGAIVSALAPKTTSDGTPSSTTGGSPTVSGTTPSVPDVTPSVSGANPAAGGLESLGLPAIPWLASGPKMIGGGTSGHRSDKNPLYESTGNSLMEVKKGGLIGHYAEGGIGGIKCLNQCPCYMPEFVNTGTPTMLQSRKHDNSNTGLRMLHQLYPLISERGNMNELSKGGLPRKYAEAAPKGHKPEFITGLTGYYACGGGTGQSDDIPAMLHDGDYVMDAETVSALGDGSSKAGREVLEGFRNQVPHKETSEGNPVAAKIADGEYVFPAGFVTAIGKGDNKKGAEILDGLREKLRMHKRSAPKDKIPPKAKSPLDYIKKV